MNIYEKLTAVQVMLKAPKDKTNEFGHYKYRNLESIMEQLKPLLDEYKLCLILEDTLEYIGNRYYVRSSAQLIDAEKPEDIIYCQSYAREAESKKGMDESQVTGACHSYAGKYCLGSLFLCDDTKDADSMNNTEPKESPKDSQEPEEPKPKRMPAGKRDYLSVMTEIQRFIGPQDFHRILGLHGFEKAEDISDRTTQLKVYAEMEKFKEEMNKGGILD